MNMQAAVSGCEGPVRRCGCAPQSRKPGIDFGEGGRGGMENAGDELEGVRIPFGGIDHTVCAEMGGERGGTDAHDGGVVGDVPLVKGLALAVVDTLDVGSRGEQRPREVQDLVSVRPIAEPLAALFDQRRQCRGSFRARVRVRARNGRGERPAHVFRPRGQIGVVAPAEVLPGRERHLLDDGAGVANAGGP